MSHLEAKVVVLGSQGVGKTSLVVRYIQKAFSSHSSSTIGASFMTKKITVDNTKVRLQIWDTAGQERFRSMAPIYYRGANAAIIVYDITSEESFQEMHLWIEELQRNMSEDLVLAVVGSKLDLAPNSRAISFSRVESYIKDRFGPKALTDGSVAVCAEVSSKDDLGVEDIFHHVTQQLVDRR
ncbi:P-loop containing nucleoside triphosphate hydrolase protein, partial [Piptocephalis cylindrospora]